jgi:hypothetical protein
MVDLQGRPPKIGKLLTSDAAALAGVLVVVEALLALAAPLS